MMSSVSERAAGRWPEILVALSDELALAVKKLGRHVPCPIHGGVDGFRLYSDARSIHGKAVCGTCGPFPNGFVLLSRLYGWSASEALKRVSDVLSGMPARKGAAVQQMENKLRAELVESRQIAIKMAALMWSEGVSVGSAKARPLRRYLKERSIPADGAARFLSRDCRFHPALPYFEKGQEVDRFPALLAIARNGDGKPCFLHRTWIAENGHGKAPISVPRKATAYFRRYDAPAIRLGENHSCQMDVAEGIETALSVAIATGRPVWSLVNTAHMSAWVAPKGVRLVTIWADKDNKRGGEIAADKLSVRLKKEGIMCSVRLPECQIPAKQKSVDWNDIIQLRGTEAFSGMYCWETINGNIQQHNNSYRIWAGF